MFEFRIYDIKVKKKLEKSGEYYGEFWYTFIETLQLAYKWKLVKDNDGFLFERVKIKTHIYNYEF